MMSRSKLYTLLASCIVLFSISCIDEITLDIDNDQQFLIVDGLVSDVPGWYQVRVNNSPRIGVGNDNILEPIEGCIVNLVDDAGGSISFIESIDERGVYQRQLVGLDREKRYHIEVTLPDGDVIVSESQSFPEAFVPIDSIDWDVIDVEFINESGNVATREFVEIYANTPPLGQEGFIRWRVSGEYQIVEKAFGLLNPRNCYVQETIDNNNVILAGTEDFNGGQIVQEPILRLPMDSRFNIVYLFGVSQYTISEEEHQYWTRIRQLINVEGTLFDPPPGILKGNMINTTNPSEQVQGFFSVSRLDFRRTFVDIATKGFFADTDCESRPNANNPEKCLDCTTLPRSTLSEPPYWR